MAVSSQCGPVQTGELKGITPYHILLNNIYSFNLLGVIFYTPVWKVVRLWYPMQLWHGVHLKFSNGWEPKLLRMNVAFDWLGIFVSKLVERCRVFGATVMQVCASVCLLGCLEDG